MSGLVTRGERVGVLAHSEIETSAEVVFGDPAVAGPGPGRTAEKRPGRKAGDLEPEGTTDALPLFLKDIGRVPLLTASREVDLAKRIERGELEANEAEPIVRLGAQRTSR